MNMNLPLYLYLVDYIGRIFGWIRPVLVFRNDVFLHYLERESKDIIEKYRQLKPSVGNGVPRIIWLLWWQGDYRENEFISKCIDRLYKIQGFKVNLLTKDTIADYIDISDILPYERKVGVQFISDLIRIRLLKSYGGIWLDASTFPLSQGFFDSILSYPFYSAKIPGIPKWKNISEGKYTTFFLAAEKGSLLMAYLDEVLISFVKKHGRQLEYLHTDFSIMMGYKNIPYIKELIDSVPVNNPNITVINRKLNEKFSSLFWERVIKNTHILKFSTKRIKNVQKQLIPESYYSFLLRYDEWS